MHNHAGTSPDRWIKSGFPEPGNAKRSCPRAHLSAYVYQSVWADCCIWGTNWPFSRPTIWSDCRRQTMHAELSTVVPRSVYDMNCSITILGILHC